MKLTFKRKSDIVEIYLKEDSSAFGAFDLQTRKLSLSPSSNGVPYAEKMAIVKTINNDLRDVEPYRKSTPSALYKGDEGDIRAAIEEENRGDYGFCPMCGADLVNGSLLCFMRSV